MPVPSLVCVSRHRADVAVTSLRRSKSNGPLVHPHRQNVRPSALGQACVSVPRGWSTWPATASRFIDGTSQNCIPPPGFASSSPANHSPSGPAESDPIARPATGRSSVSSTDRSRLPVARSKPLDDVLAVVDHDQLVPPGGEPHVAGPGVQVGDLAGVGVDLDQNRRRPSGGRRGTAPHRRARRRRPSRRAGRSPRPAPAGRPGRRPGHAAASPGSASAAAPPRAARPAPPPRPPRDPPCP